MDTQTWQGNSLATDRTHRWISSKSGLLLDTYIVILHTHVQSSIYNVHRVSQILNLAALNALKTPWLTWCCIHDLVILINIYIVPLKVQNKSEATASGNLSNFHHIVLHAEQVSFERRTVDSVDIPLLTTGTVLQQHAQHSLLGQLRWLHVDLDLNWPVRPLHSLLYLPT